MMTTGGSIQNTLGRANQLYQVLENRVMTILGIDAHHEILRPTDNELHNIRSDLSNLLVL